VTPAAPAGRTSTRATPPAGVLAGVAPSGPVLFARYAFGPNRLGLCGPEDWRSLLEAGAAGADREIRQLAMGFEGAYPYLQLVARASGIEDPLDRRVVEAYWLGSELSDGVEPERMASSLALRFRPRVTPGEWRWLAAKPAAGARPTHAFHVLDVFPRMGLLRGGKVHDALSLMDSCRIRWGRVSEVAGDRLVVESRGLELVDGRLRLGVPRPSSVQRWLDGRGFVDDVMVGDVVSLHWDWACDRLSATQLRNLVDRTRRHIAIANQTI
jgi:hypothetical protein